MTSCTQPSCTGTIVDDYCDVCGSPAGAAPFTPTAVEAQRIDGEKELAENKPGDAKDYRTRIEEAQLPDDVRKAALREVSTLERTNDEGPESGDIRAWLDTILELPWSAKTADWMDIQGSREVEATLRTLIEPEAADIEEPDTAKPNPVAADTEEPDTAKPDPVTAAIENADGAAAEPHHDDTEETPAVVEVPSGGRHPQPQLQEQQVAGAAPAPTPAQKRRFGSLALAATALGALFIGAFFFGASRDDSVTAVSAPTATTTPTAAGTDAGVPEPTIELKDPAGSAKPFETVRIQGRYRGGGDTFLRVQRKEEGKWVDFPLPTKTDESGNFTAYVEFGQPGRYRLRLVDPNSGVASRTFVLPIKR